MEIVYKIDESSVSQYYVSKPDSGISGVDEIARIKTNSIMEGLDLVLKNTKLGRVNGENKP